MNNRLLFKINKLRKRRANVIKTRPIKGYENMNSDADYSKNERQLADDICENIEIITKCCGGKRVWHKTEFVCSCCGMPYTMKQHEGE